MGEATSRLPAPVIVRRVVLVNGCWDPYHYGHLLHLQAAKALGDVLVVSITADDMVKKEKGRDRPLFTHAQRACVLKALRCVDRVVIVESVLEALRFIKPHIFVKGSDYIGNIDNAVLRHCEREGIEIRFTDTQKWSATEIGSVLRQDTLHVSRRG